MMDKKTIWVVIGCLVALVAWQRVINWLYPPKPKAPKPAVEAAATNQPVPEVTPALPKEPVEAIKEAPAEAELPLPPEQTVVLHNELVRVTFTSHGGGVQSVELLAHRANGEGNIVLNGQNFAPALSLATLAGAGANAAYEIQQPAPNAVVMRTKARDGFDVIKKFTLGDGYVIDGSIEFASSAGNTNAPATVDLAVGTATPATAKETADFLSVGWLVGEKYLYRGIKQIDKNATKNITGEVADAKWAAVKSQFFTMIVTPATNAVEVQYQKVELAPAADWKGKQPPYGVAASVIFPATSRPTPDTEVFSFQWYAGPKAYERLAALGKGQEDVMQFGFWSAISVVLLKSMKFFYNLIPNYGIAIILITVIIKILFWPIQAKSIKSMKAMQKFQPMMTKLREKYKDDAQRLNQEMMKLYKEHKINPLAGCLPMLVQIPVFFALFAMLRSSIELRGASFLWIKDLSQPDTVAHLLGFPLNPLPLVMGISMIWQMKLTPSGGDPKQQQMMMFMPLMFLFICYKMSSGLVLYWTVQQFLSIAQQWWSMRQPDGPPATAQPLPAGKVK